MLVNEDEEKNNDIQSRQKVFLASIHYISVLFFWEYCFSGVPKNFQGNVPSRNSKP